MDTNFTFHTAVMAAFIVSTATFAQPVNADKTVWGPAKKLGNGTVRSWVTLDSKGAPKSLGIQMKGDAMNGLQKPNKAVPNPSYDTHEIQIELPKEAALTPFDHIGVDWNPQGHDPEGVYMIPHFDFHLYTITRQDRKKITLQGEDMERCKKQPDAAFLPKGFIYGPDTEVPNMGAHWVDASTPEFHGKRFTYTFIFGSYNGGVCFIEPMITREFLMAGIEVNAEVPQPAKFAWKGKYFPTRYRVHHNKSTKSIDIIFEGFKKR